MLREQIIPSKDTTFLSKVSPWGSLVQSNKFQIGLIEANNKGHLGNLWNNVFQAVRLLRVETVRGLGYRGYF